MEAICDVNFKEFAKISDPIKERHKKRLAHKVSKIRMIESKEKRIVNFIFTNPFPVRLNEFSLRLRKFFDGKLDQYVSETEERVNGYIEKIKNDELDEDDADQTPYPISYSQTTHLTLDISNIGRISLATSDDPFFKLPPSHKKFFPEMVIYNKEGEILEKLDETKSDAETVTKGTFEADVRDAKLKLNDDRKCTVSLATQKDVQMVVFAVKSKDLSSQGDIKPNEFDRAQFRLIDDETNQTLDTAKIRDVQVTLPTPEGEGDEEAQPEPEPEDDEEAKAGPQPQNVIVVGRAYLEGDKWIYEQYHYMFREDKHPDFFEKLGTIEKESRTYFQDKEKEIKEEEKALKDSKEAAAQAAAAKAASKKKGNKKDNKKKKEEKEEEKEEEKAEEAPQVDTDHMPGFKTVLDEVYSKVIGPIPVELTEEKWDQKKVEKDVHRHLKKALGETYANCKHGFEFRIGNKVRNPNRKQILKYSRNAQNLEILPIVPPELQPEEPADEGEDKESEGDQE